MAPTTMASTEETDTSLSSIRPRQPDKYHGQRDFLLLGNWIFSVDQYFILTDMPAYKQGPFVSTLLRDEALLWYRSSYDRWDPATPLTWEILRTAMREYFAPPNEDRCLQDEWANLRQHVSVLTTLAMQIPGLSQSQILDKFIRGLNPKTRIEVELRDPQTPDEAYRLADRFDRIVYGVRNASFLTQN
jgi:Retrotransposon gag protein